MFHDKCHHQMLFHTICLFACDNLVIIMILELIIQPVKMSPDEHSNNLFFFAMILLYKYHKIRL